MQKPQVDLAVKRRLKPVWVSIRAFYAKETANSFRASVLRAAGEETPAPTPPGGSDHSSNPSYATGQHNSKASITLKSAKTIFLQFKHIYITVFGP